MRDIACAFAVELRDTNLYPSRAAEILVKLTAIIGNCLDEIRHAEHDFNVVLLQHLDAEAKANRARMRAEISPEYLKLREAKDTKELVESMIGGLKYQLRGFEAEMRLSR